MADAKDPLSLLAGDSSSSESEEEDDKNTGDKIPLTDKSYYTPTLSDADKLPSPTTLFATVTQPRFLTAHVSPHQVNWDKLVKSVDTPTPDPDSAHSSSKPAGHYSAIPPPKELETTSEISAAPVRYAQEDDSNDDSLPIGESAPPSQVGDKRSSSSAADNGTSSVSKKAKVETFREKEKRKRDLGMSSRGKNFVEEEKRILREQYGK